MALNNVEQLIDDFEFIDDWEERYKYLIELGRDLPNFPEELRNSHYKVQGCVSQVWLVSEIIGKGENSQIKFTGDSDALIVRGLIAVMLMLYSGKTPAEILAIDANDVLAKLGLNEHLTPQRSNGLAAMVKRIRHYATQAATA